MVSLFGDLHQIAHDYTAKLFSKLIVGLMVEILVLIVQIDDKRVEILISFGVKQELLEVAEHDSSVEAVTIPSYLSEVGKPLG